MLALRDLDVHPHRQKIALLLRSILERLAVELDLLELRFQRDVHLGVVTEEAVRPAGHVSGEPVGHRVVEGHFGGALGGSVAFDDAAVTQVAIGPEVQLAAVAVPAPVVLDGHEHRVARSGVESPRDPGFLKNARFRVVERNEPQVLSAERGPDRVQPLLAAEAFLQAHLDRVAADLKSAARRMRWLAKSS